MTARPKDPASGDDRNDPAIVAARRRRERLLAELDRTKEELSLANRELARARAQLAATRGTTGYRTERAVRGSLRAALNRASGPGRNRAKVGPTIDPGATAPGATGPGATDPGATDPGVAAARRERASLADRLASAEPPIRLAIVCPATVRGGEPEADSAARANAIAAALRSVGLEAAVVVASSPAGPEPGIGPGTDIALAIEPSSGIDHWPRRIIRIGWMGTDPGPWLAIPHVNELDLLLVADEASRAAVEASTAKSASVIPDPASPAGAAGLRDALLRWLAAPQAAIHISPPTWEAADSWGDTPFGRDVQKAFERHGWPATLHVFADRDDEAALRADLTVHIVGVRAPAVRSGQTSVLWIISHPDMVRRDACRPYDLVAVASDSFLAYLGDWLGPDAPAMIPLHQATDPDRFFPEPGGARHELLFVGSARPVRRPFLETLSGTSHELAVYGRNWTADLLDPRHVRGEWIANTDLHRAYSAAAIVLSDSWADMRDEGFIPNRIYDALASGAFVVSEAIPGLEAEFDGAVATYRDQAELLTVIDHYLAEPAERATLAEAGRRAVLARHTFDARVAAIIAALELFQ